MKRILSFSLFITLSLQAVPLFGMSRFLQRAAQPLSRYFNRAQGMPSVAPQMRQTFAQAQNSPLFTQRAFMSTNVHEQTHQQSYDHNQEQNDQKEKSRSWKDYFYDTAQKAKEWAKKLWSKKVVQYSIGVGAAAVENQLEKNQRLEEIKAQLEMLGESANKEKALNLLYISAHDILSLLRKEGYKWECAIKQLIQYLSAEECKILLTNLLETGEQEESGLILFLLRRLYQEKVIEKDNILKLAFKKLSIYDKREILLGECYDALVLPLLETSETFNQYRFSDDYFTIVLIVEQILQELGMQKESQSTKISLYEQIYIKYISIINKQNLCQTDAHVVANPFSIFILLYEGSGLDKASFSIFKEAYEYEKLIEATNKREQQSNEKFVFYHGMQWKIYWLQLLYTALYEAKYKKTLNNYHFVRFPEDINCKQLGAMQQESNSQRKNVMSLGDPRLIPSGESSYPRALIFLNYALAAYSHLGAGNNTMYYVAKNSNCFAKAYVPNQDEIFDKFGTSFKNAYMKHTKELEEVFAVFNSMSKHGALLQFIMPAQLAEKHIYPTTDYGYRVSYNIRNSSVTSSPVDLVRALKKDATQIGESAGKHQGYYVGSDKIQFCMVGTPDTIYRLQEKGAEIRVYHTADKQKLEDIKQRLRALAQKIADEAMQSEKETYNPRECYKKAKELLQAKVS